MKSIISSNCRIRHPEFFQVGDDSIVDDYCYFSTRVVVGRCSHIASGCSVGGGSERCFRLGNFSSLSSGVKVWCTSDDFVNDLVVIPPQGLLDLKSNLITGDVEIGDYTAVGSNAVIMPCNFIPQGTVIGALSFVPPEFKFEEWSVYAGNPLRLIRLRNRESVLKQVEKLNAFLKERNRG